MDAAVSNTGLLMGKSARVRKADLYLDVTLMLWSFLQCAALVCALILPW